MPTFDQEIEIDVDDFLYECSKYEIKEIIEYLEKNDYIKQNSAINQSAINQSSTNNDWYTMIIKILDNKHQLTNEDINLINNIYKKLV